MFTSPVSAGTLSAMGPLCMYYSFQLSIFKGFLTVSTNESLNPLPPLGLFPLCCLFYLILISFHLILLSYIYYIIFLYKLFFYFLMRERMWMDPDRKGSGKEWKEHKEGNHNQNKSCNKKINFQFKKQWWTVRAVQSLWLHKFISPAVSADIVSLCHPSPLDPTIFLSLCQFRSLNPEGKCFRAS